MDEIISLSYRGNNSAICQLSYRDPFSECFHFYYLAEIWKLFQIQSCLEVYDNFKGHLAGQLLSPDKQSLPKYNTFNKLLFLYYCPPVIILRQKTHSFPPKLQYFLHTTCPLLHNPHNGNVPRYELCLLNTGNPSPNLFMVTTMAWPSSYYIRKFTCPF